jgi:hypothetical protein
MPADRNQQVFYVRLYILFYFVNNIIRRMNL